MNSETKSYSPITQEEIDKVIAQSKYPDELEKLLDTYYLGLDQPCSVSLGVDFVLDRKNTRVDVLQQILQSHGIDAVSRLDPDAQNVSKYVLDHTGLSMPFMNPHDALKATAEINDIFQSHGLKISGYALPVSGKALSPSTPYGGVNINVEKEIDADATAQKILDNRGMKASDFIAQQIEASRNLPEINVMEETERNAKEGFPRVYRGGTLGNNPYAVVAANRPKDCAYASQRMNTAQGYACGLAVHYVSDAVPLQYGFIYEYERQPFQEFSPDYGIETGRKSECVAQYYEVPVFPHQNPLKGVYLATSDGRVVKITDENGKYINKDWEDFMQIHSPRTRQGNEYCKQRVDQQIDALSKNEVFSYVSPSRAVSLNLTSCDNVDLSGMDLSQYEVIQFPKKLEKFSSSICVLPDKIRFSGVEELSLGREGSLKDIQYFPDLKILDLSECDDLDLSGADLSQMEDLKLPDKIKSMEGIKLPASLKQLDLGKCDDINLSGADLSQVEDLKFPRNIKSLAGTKFPEKVDLSNCLSLNLSGADFSHAYDLKFPRNIESLEGTKFPQKVDFSNCFRVNLSGADLSQVEDVIFSSNIESLEGTKFPKKVDLSRCYNVNLEGADFSQVEDLKLPSNIKSLEGIKLSSSLKCLDLSNCDNVNLSGADLSQVEDLKLPSSMASLEGTKFPKKIDLSICYNANFAGADFSQVEDLKLPSSMASLEGTKFPKKIDLSICYNANFAGADFSQVEDLKLPSGIKSLEGVKLPKNVDLSNCYSVDWKTVDLSTVENLKVFSCENMDLSNFNGNLEFSQKNISIMNSKLPPSLKSLDLSNGMALISETNMDGIEELKLPEHMIVGSMDDAEKKMMELCNGDASKLESMAVAVITPESVPNNLKRLDISACKDIDLRNWNLEKIEDLKLSKDFDVSKLPEGIMEKNPAVARAVKISRGEAVEDLIQTSVGKGNAAVAEPKAEVKAKNEMAEKINQLRGVSQSSAVTQTGENLIEKTAERAAVNAGVNAGKTSEGIVETLAKADNAVNQAIEKTIDKGSELLNNTAVGKAYEKATDAIANTKVVKAVEKGAAKTVEKAAQTAVGKSVVKAVAKTTGSAVGKSVLKKVPLVSVAAGCYFAWDRVKDGDWKGACGEVASGLAGCFPGVGTAASAAIDVGLAAKDISGAIAEAKAPEASAPTVTEEDSGKSKEDMRQIILQKQGRIAAESKTPVKSSEISNQVLQQRMVQQGRG